MSMRYFEFRDGKSDKFWEIRTDALRCTYTVRYGNIGSKGRQTSKDLYPDPNKMHEQAKKLIAEKTGKGYVEKDMLARAMASLAAASESIAYLEEARRLNRKVPWDLTMVPTQFPNLEHGGLAWRFLVDEIPYKEVDRSKSMMKGPFFITEEYPIPTTKDGKHMVPIIQADLRELSKLRGLPLGDGLFQAWWTWNEDQCRVIPRKVVDEQEPLPFPMDINAFLTTKEATSKTGCLQSRFMAKTTMTTNEWCLSSWAMVTRSSVSMSRLKMRRGKGLSLSA